MTSSAPLGVFPSRSAVPAFAPLGVFPSRSAVPAFAPLARATINANLNAAGRIALAMARLETKRRGAAESRPGWQQS